VRRMGVPGCYFGAAAVEGRGGFFVGRYLAIVVGVWELNHVNAVKTRHNRSIDKNVLINMDSRITYI